MTDKALKIYVVTCDYSHDSSNVLGVFGSAELANKAADEHSCLADYHTTEEHVLCLGVPHGAFRLRDAASAFYPIQKNHGRNSVVQWSMSESINDD